jgi:molybdate transport system substrate-binding protein
MASRFRRIVLAAGLAAAAGCARPQNGSEILVAAASDLAGAMPELAAAFEAESGVRVVATLGSSGQLAQQVLQGAPVDVFLAADEGWVDRLEAAGRLEADTRAVYAYGVLVVLTGRRDAPSTLGELAGPSWTRIAIANPEHAPYGRAAEQALRSAGILDEVRSRLIFAENVRQTVQFAETGSVDASLSALSLMDSTRHRWFRLPAGLHEPLAQTAAVIAGRDQPDAARAFVAFLLGADGREILARYRFVLP